MSIGFQIPLQSRFISTSTIFEALFNIPTPGRYDFNVAANQNINVIELQRSTVYLIERLSAGGTINDQQYLESIVDFPELTIKRSVSSAIVYQRPLPIVNYTDNTECATWINSDKGNDFLSLSFKGSLRQLPSMVGIASVKMQISLSIYAIDSVYFNTAFRDVQSASMGQSNRR